MLRDKIKATALCVEFDLPTSLAKALGMIARLKKGGFEPVQRDRDNFLFMRRDS